MPQRNFIDSMIEHVDTALQTIFPPENRAASRPSPGVKVKESPMQTSQKRHIAGLMRVNHTGEVCAQALYQGQSITAKLPHIREQMEHAAAEEIDHLAWCEMRLHELNSHPSVLNPFWYSGSLMLGIIAGLAGDKWSLGFVAETERQVTAHLEKHLQNIPNKDLKTKAILQQMQEDESQHAESAQIAGAAELPAVIKRLMSTVSKLMTKSSYYV